MLKNINEFSLDRKKDPIKLNQELINYIDNFVKDDNFNDIISWISRATEVSSKSLSCDCKLFIFNQFENIKGKFNYTFKFSNIFISSLKFLFIMIYIRIFSTKKTNIKKTKLIIDDVDKFINIERYNHLNKLIDLILISKVDVGKNFNFYKFSKKTLFLRNKYIKNNLSFIFSIFFKSITLSIKLKTNIIPIIISIIFKYFKYETIFSNIKGDFLLQERHYSTSAIKNEIFKKKGGIITSSMQRNLIQLNGPGMFINCDLLLTLGKKSADNLQQYGCNVKKKIPIGSFYMEDQYYKKKDYNSFPSYDLISFESNQKDTKFHATNEIFFDDMYLHFEWIKKFSTKHPKLRIGIKHKNYITDQREIEMFKDLKNVSHLVNKRDDETDSYHLGAKAKALCTWTSTLGYEFIGNGKDCLYLDPGGRNTAFLRNSKENSLIRVTKYEDFELKVINMIKKGNIFVENSLRDNFCLKSTSVSENIIKAYDQY
jgi:hypothetical protein